MSVYDRQLQAADQEIDRLAKAAQAIIDGAEAEDREPTDAEQTQIDELLRDVDNVKAEKASIEAKKATRERIKEAGKGLAFEKDAKVVNQDHRVKSIGDQFIESMGYKNVLENGLAGQWSTGHIELDSKATLLEGTIASPGAGGPLSPIDQRTGVQPILFERLTVANLLAQGTTNSNGVRYVVEETATNAAATVAEGGTKPESTLAFSEVDEPVRKIATVLPVSDEMLEDAAQIRSYINARLTLFVMQEEEDQLLNGNNTGTNLNGLLNRVTGNNDGVYSAAAGAQAADHIYTAITRVRTDSFLEPDGIVINPEDWADLRLLKDDNGNYIAGTPFNNGAAQPGESLFAKRVVVTSAMPQGTALVGAFQTAAQVFRRGGITVEASNSHSDYFVKNLTAIRAEERLALAVYRPEAFATVDLNGAAT